MDKTISEIIEEYKLAYLTPVYIYTKKEQGVLKNDIVFVPNLADYFCFTAKVLSAMLLRVAVLVCQRN